MKKKHAEVKCMFLDIGGVLLTDGWELRSRKLAARKFELDFTEFETRHRMTFETFELGKLTIDDYLNLVVFYEKRSFTRAHFRRFMFDQSKPYPRMIKLITDLRNQYHFKVIVVSNEARELNAHRIQVFKLGKFVDSFISSCFIHARKPDADVFQLALDIAQVPIHQIVYLENTPMFIRVAKALGIRSILHTDYNSTCKALASLGLRQDERIVHDSI